MRHAELVSEAADRILLEFQTLGVSCDSQTIELGAILHDAGKIQHLQELSEPGSLHELAGEALLLAHGVQPEIARCCATHGGWNLPDVSLEERTVAMADKLWKG
jgi:HD superfamily phosphodiesterase